MHQVLSLALAVFVAVVDRRCGATLVTENIMSSYTCMLREYPFLVAIQASKMDHKRNLHSGTILSPSWILTSASAFADMKSPEHYEVVAGSGNRLITDKMFLYKHFWLNSYMLHTQTMDVARYHLHEEYAAGGGHDVAVVKLRNQLKMTTNVHTVNLPDPHIFTLDPVMDLNPGGMILNFVDGDTSEHQIYALRTRQLLSCLPVPIVSGRECTGYAKMFTKTIADDQICTMGRWLTEEMCRVSLGGPLLFDDMQIGIVIQKTGCHLRARHAIYTRIDRNLEWIRKMAVGFEKETDKLFYLAMNGARGIAGGALFGVFAATSLLFSLRNPIGTC